MISNSNWTEWSTVQGVAARVISKSDEREARGWVEIMSTITPWIVRYEVQSLINRIYNTFRIKNVFWEFLLSENVSRAFSIKVLKTVENIAKEAIKARIIDMKITWVSNLKKFKSDTRVITRQLRDIDTRRTNHDREICYRYDLLINILLLNQIQVQYSTNLEP